MSEVLTSRRIRHHRGLPLACGGTLTSTSARCPYFLKSIHLCSICLASADETWTIALGRCALYARDSTTVLKNWIWFHYIKVTACSSSSSFTRVEITWQQASWLLAVKRSSRVALKISDPLSSSFTRSARAVND